MRKCFVIVIFNLLILASLFYLSEFLSYNFLYGNLEDSLFDFFHNNDKSALSHIDFKKLSYAPKKLYSQVHDSLPQRNDETLDYIPTKRPILLLGCSYTYGQGIKISKIFSSQLQIYTKRKTFNSSQMGFSPDANLKSINMMKKDNMLKNNNYQYVIYTWMYNHINRISKDISLDYLSEKAFLNKNKSIKNKVIFFTDKLYTVKLFKLKIILKKEKNIYEYQKFVIKRIYNLIKEDIPDVKFIFLIFQDLKDESEHGGMEYSCLDINNWKDLEKQGITIISTDELTKENLWDNKYKLKYDIFQSPAHPNEKAWEVIVPALAKKFNL